MPRWDGHESDLGHLEEKYNEFINYLASQGIAARSYKQYRFCVSDIASIGKPLNQITAQDLLNLEKDMRERLAPGTVKNRKAQIGSFLQWCEYGTKTKRGVYPDAVMDAWKNGSNHRPKGTADQDMAPPKAMVGLEDLKEMLRHVAKLAPEQQIRNRALIALLWDTGARAGEIVAEKKSGAEGLKISDVKLYEDHAEIHVPGRKNAFSNRFGVPVVFSVPYLRRWLEVHPDPKKPDSPLWITERGAQIEYKYLNQLFKDLLSIMRRDGYPIPKETSLHSLRHGRAQHAKNVEGMNDETMRWFFGWKPGSKMPSRYGGMADAAKVVLTYWGVEKQKAKTAKKDTCPSCKADIMQGSAFCPNCGEPLSEQGKQARVNTTKEMEKLRETVAALKDAVSLILVRDTFDGQDAMLNGLIPEEVIERIKARAEENAKEAGKIIGRLFDEVEPPKVIGSSTPPPTP